MEKYDFIKCKKCGEPLNKIIYGHLSKVSLPKHTVSVGCEKTKYAFECSNYNCKKRYTKKEVFKTSFLPFVKPKLCEGFEVGYDKEWDLVIKQRQVELKENFENILNEINNLTPNTKFNFSHYFNKYNIPNKERLSFFYSLLDFLQDGVAMEKEYQNAIAGLPFNIPHFKTEKIIHILNPQSKEGISEILHLVESEKLYTVTPPKTVNGVTTLGYITYDSRLTKYFKHLGAFEYDSLENVKEVSAKEIDELTNREVKLYLLAIFRQEKLCEGLISSYLEDGRLAKLLKHFLEVSK